LFVIDFLIGIGMLVAFLLLALIASSPLLLWLSDVNALRTIGTIAAIGLGLALFTLWVLAAIGLSVLRQFFFRACVLEGLGVDDSIRRGFALARQRALDALIIALILFGIGLGWFIVMIRSSSCSPLRGVVGWFARPGDRFRFQPGLEWRLALGDRRPGGPADFPVGLAVPLLFLNGLLKVFVSTTWTLTYREARPGEPARWAVEPPAGDLESGSESISLKSQMRSEVARKPGEDLANLCCLTNHLGKTRRLIHNEVERFWRVLRFISRECRTGVRVG
jgi:hypothetical protein